MNRKLNLKKDTLVQLTGAELGAVGGAAQTLQSGCASGVAPCYPTYRCFTPVSVLPCDTDLC